MRIVLLIVCAIWRCINALRLQMSGKSGAIVVVGCAGGAAESIATKLISGRIDATVTVILDRKPLSPLLRQVAADTRSPIFWGDFDKDLDGLSDGSKATLDTLLQNKIVLAVADEGDEKLRYGDVKLRDKPRPPAVLGAVAKRLSASVVAVVCSTDSGSDATGGLGGLFGKKPTEAIRDFCAKNSVPFSLLRYGKLTGGVPGNEPLPFLGLPALEPELHPSYVLQAVVLTDAKSKYSNEDECTREALAETNVRLLGQGTLALEGQVVSIAGQAPSDKEWNQLFARLKAGDNTELLRLDFGEVLKPQALVNWLVDGWFPQALIDADAATILSGARPVRAVKTGDRRVRIVWEDILPDLTVRNVGGVELQVQTEEQPGIVAVRLSGGSLPGEAQLMDKLIEGVNKNVYKKQLATPKA